MFNTINNKVKIKETKHILLMKTTIVLTYKYQYFKRMVRWTVSGYKECFLEHNLAIHTNTLTTFKYFYLVISLRGICLKDIIRDEVKD